VLTFSSFVDFAGRTGEVVDGLTGEVIPVQIFVAVLGASSFTEQASLGGALSWPCPVRC
jgi:hypothetical protein